MSSKLVRHKGRLPILSRPASDIVAEERIERPEPPETRLDLPGLYGYVVALTVRRKWLILSVALLVTAVAATQVFTMTPVYRATSKIEIQPDSARVLPYKDRSDAAENYLTTETYVQTQKEVVRSQALALRVIEELDLEREPAFVDSRRRGVFIDVPKKIIRWVASHLATEEAESEGGGSSDGSGIADHLIEDLGVEVVINTRLLTIHYDSASPDLAKLVLNTLTDQLIELEFTARLEAAAKAREFLERQLVELKASVDQSEAALADYAKNRNIISVDGRQQLAMEKLAHLSHELTGIETEMIAEEAVLHELRQTDLEEFSPNLDDEEINQLEGRLSALKQQLASLSARFGTDWPDTRRAQREIIEVTEQLEAERRRAIRDANERHAALQKRHALLAIQLNRQKQLANQLDQDLIQYDTLEQAAETNRAMYDGLLQRLKEVGVATGLKMSNVRVLDRAGLPSEVHHPNRPVFTLLSMVLGLVIGLVSAFFVESTDLTVRTSEEVESLIDAPCLGVIPMVPGSAKHGVKDELDQVCGDPVASFIALDNAGAWEAYRSLRTSILYSARQPAARTIMVASPQPGEGRTFTAVNLAIALAQLGARVVLVDLDFRSPGVGKVLGLNGRSGGMSEFLWKAYDEEISSYIRETDIPNLSAIPAGRRPPNPPELIGSERTCRALESLKDGFDVVIIDTPPVLEYTDGIVLSPLVDQVLLVARGGETPRRALETAHSQLLQVQARIMGGVINAADMRSPELVYRHGGSRRARRSKGGGLLGRIRT